MKLSNKILILVATLICILVSAVMLFQYKNNNDIKIIVSDNKIVEDYAKKYNFELEKLSDSKEYLYKKNIELFDYNAIQNGVEITKYSGISKVLVIPEMINSSKVISIKKEALSKLKVETIVISKYIENLPTEELKNVKIKCYNNNFCNELKKNNELDVEILSDSDYTDFNNNDLQFEYNIDNSIELTKYISSNKDIVIPETINGYEVTKISLDVKELDVNSIYIPNTVEKIDIKIDNQNETNIILSIIINLLTLIIFSIIIFINNSKNKEESFINMSVYVLSMIYLLIQYICMLNATTNIISSSVIRLVVYLIIVLPLILIRKRIKNYDNKVKESGSFIRESMSIIDDLDIIEYSAEEKELLNRIKEDLRFSDPVSSGATEVIENEIKSLLLKDEKNNLAEIERLIKKRNKICKETK